MSVVFALATPPAKSAICIFRVSGPGCLSKIPELTGSPLEKNKKFYLRSVKNKSGDVVDRVGIISFKGPDSYTGEDSFEVYACLLYTSPSPRDRSLSRMPSSA